ncbi:MAG TPA: hypothetical protein VF982_03365 [Anaerolineales bacterium]
MEEVQLELLRQAAGWRKLELVDDLNRAVRELNLAGLRARYPQDNEEKLRRRLADLLLGAELAEKVYGAYQP